MVPLVDDRTFVFEGANPAAMKDAIYLLYGFHYQQIFRWP
jgi:hypothetical protein